MAETQPSDAVAGALDNPQHLARRPDNLHHDRAVHTLGRREHREQVRPRQRRPRRTGDAEAPATGTPVSTIATTAGAILLIRPRDRTRIGRAYSGRPGRARAVVRIDALVVG